MALMGKGGKISYKHIDDLVRQDMYFVTTARQVEVGWLKERLERRRKGEGPPPIPRHLG